MPPRLPHHFQTVSAGSPAWAFARPGALPNGSASGPDFLSPARDVTYKFPGMGATVVPRNKRYAAIYIYLQYVYMRHLDKTFHKSVYGLAFIMFGACSLRLDLLGLLGMDVHVSVPGPPMARICIVLFVLVGHLTSK